LSGAEVTLGGSRAAGVAKAADAFRKGHKGTGLSDVFSLGNHAHAPFSPKVS